MIKNRGESTSGSITPDTENAVPENSRTGVIAYEALLRNKLAGGETVDATCIQR